MTLVQLEYLLALHKHKSFVKASRACFVTQPTLSMQIQKLEDELGVILFDRKKKPIETTAIGLEVVAQAQEVLANAKAVSEVVQQYQQSESGELSVGIIPTVAPYLLPLFLSDFRKKLPEVHLVIEELTTEQIIDGLLADNLDLGILATPLGYNRITEYPLYTEGMVFYVSPNHALYDQSSIDLNDLRSKDLWLLNKGHCFRNQVINLCDHFKPTEPSSFLFESGSIETLLKIIDSDTGITMIPETAVKGLSKRQQQHLRPVKGKAPGREISIVVSRTYLKKGLINKLSGIIKASVEPDLKAKPRHILNPL